MLCIGDHPNITLCLRGESTLPSCTKLSVTAVSTFSSTIVLLYTSVSLCSLQHLDHAVTALCTVLYYTGV